MRNIQVIDGAENCAYDVFAVTDEQFGVLFPDQTDIAFMDEIMARLAPVVIDPIFKEMWARRVPKCQVCGIHGTLFFELEQKKQYYPTRKDEQAINPDGSLLRGLSS